MTPLRAALSLLLTAACLPAAGLPTPATAQTPEQIEARVADAARLFESEGFDAFCTRVSDPAGPYRVDDAYVFALTLRGRLVCHPKPETLNVPTGAPSAVPDMLDNARAAAPSGAWTHYPWPHPETLEIGVKDTYCQLAGPLMICAGDFFVMATS